MNFLIIMASGKSKRFGEENKLLYLFHQKALYRHLIDELLKLKRISIEDYEIIIVTCYEEIIEQMKDLPLYLVKNKEDNGGITSSIHLGIKKSLALEKEKTANNYLFFTADQPFLKAEVIEEFIQKFTESKCTIGCMVNKDKLGNPGIFMKKHLTELLALDGDRGGKQIIKKYQTEAFLYPVSDKMLIDIDNKERLKQLEGEKFD